MKKNSTQELHEQLDFQSRYNGFLNDLSKLLCFGLDNTVLHVFFVHRLLCILTRLSLYFEFGLFQSVVGVQTINYCVSLNTKFESHPPEIEKSLKK